MSSIEKGKTKHKEEKHMKRDNKNTAEKKSKKSNSDDKIKGKIFKTSKNTPKKDDVKKSSKKKESKTIQIHVWNIKLSKDSRKRLNKIKNNMWGSVSNAIECGNWYIPVKNYLFTHIKKSLEDGMREFFSLDKDVSVEINDFMTNIIEYDNHR